MKNFNPMTFAQELSRLGSGKAPAPVALWDPPYCGEIDLIIKKDGSWWYQGSPIARAEMVALFARVLKREGDAYYLVTPVEKLKIAVEQAPFLITALRPHDHQGQQELYLYTSLGDECRLDAEHPLRVANATDNPQPYVLVRSGMEGLIARPIYYQMIELCEIDRQGDTDVFIISSAGHSFELGRAPIG